MRFFQVLVLEVHFWYAALEWTWLDSIMNKSLAYFLYQNNQVPSNTCYLTYQRSSKKSGIVHIGKRIAESRMHAKRMSDFVISACLGFYCIYSIICLI